MTTDSWYLVFAAIAGIGALWMLRGKTLDKNEKAGVWIIFGGFALQTIWYVFKSGWEVSAMILLAVFVLFSLIVYFGFKGKGRPKLKV
jgi:hypothetical protein